MNRFRFVCTFAGCLATTSALGLVALPQWAHAKGKPAPPDKWDAAFFTDAGFGNEISGSSLEAASKTYRTVFGTGDVVVTLADGTILDHSPFLMRATDDVTGERYLFFRIGVRGGHQNKDRYSTPGGGIGGVGDTVIPFPETTVITGGPWLEVVAGNVDANLDMEPGAHVILHLHVDNVPLIGMTGHNAGQTIGYISIGDIEFTFPP